MVLVKTGLQRFIQESSRYKDRDIALIVNHTSVTASLEYSWDVLTRQGIPVKRVFSPEHGLFGTEQDQDPVEKEPAFPFEIVSLYGTSYETLIPEKHYLEDIDLVIFDIQDIGTRYYTFVNTMILFMQAIKDMDIEFMVLDRPNPLGGTRIEGPLLAAGYESFVGIFPIPVRHGLTAGELAVMAKDFYKLDITLTVFEMEGWTRDMLFPDTGLPWIPPSPNMPTVSTAAIYPGLCLLEGLNISEGRGTTTPFEMIGAPFIDPYTLARNLNELTPEGLYFRPVYFIPTFNKYAGEVCGGVFIHITDAAMCKPFLAGVSIAAVLNKLYPEFEFLSGVYEFNTTHAAFDLLSGSSRVREMILAGESVKAIGSTWVEDEKEFEKLKQGYHIYKVY
ncbi:MAG: DUF1343 domain-containing protein [bacterium]|nr:DUF1343 domain-containing protein [bacterium]